MICYDPNLHWWLSPKASRSQSSANRELSIFRRDYPAVDHKVWGYLFTVIVWIVKQGWPWPAWAQGSWWRWGSAPLTCCKLHPSAAPRSSQWTKDVRIQNSNIKMVFWIHFGFSVTSWTAESIFWYLLSRMSFTNLTLSAHIVILKLQCFKFHWLFSKQAFVWFNFFVASNACEVTLWIDFHGQGLNET